MGGLNRTGGAANGMPRYCLTMTVDEGRDIAVPTMAPESMIAIGGESADGVAKPAARLARPKNSSERISRLSELGGYRLKSSELNITGEATIENYIPLHFFRSNYFFVSFVSLGSKAAAYLDICPLSRPHMRGSVLQPLRQVIRVLAEFVGSRSKTMHLAEKRMKRIVVNSNGRRICPFRVMLQPDGPGVGASRFGIEAWPRRESGIHAPGISA